MNMMTPIEPICVRVDEAARMLGLGRTKLYELIGSGEITAIKLGKATRITTESLRDFVRRQRCLGTRPIGP